MLFTASWRAGFPTGTWTVKRDGVATATLRRKLLAPQHTYAVAMNGHTFLLRNKLGMSRVMVVEGGPYDGAVLSGNPADLQFRLEHRGVPIGEAESTVLSMHDHHSLRLLASDDPATEGLAALMMIALLIQKYEES